MSKGSGGVQITEYSMSAHYGWCLSGNVRVRALYFGEKLAWEGDVSTLSTIDIDRADLFGGDEKEGGVVGRVIFYPGNDDQLLTEECAGKLERTPTTVTGYRGFVSTWFLGAVSGGFVWAVNNPYLKTLWGKFTRMPVGIGLPNGTAFIGDHANPAHIIYECLTSEDCMGAPSSLIDIAAFTQVAEDLFDEAFMISIGWFNQDTIEAFISEVLDHIQATVFVNPETGLLTIKLLRDDYDIDDLPLFDETNSKLTGFARKSLGETVNEIQVEYTNPENEELVGTSAQDLGNIIAQGGIVSTSRTYQGVRTPELAGRIAARDVASAAAPLGTGTLEVNRTGWDLVPGGVIRVSNVKQKLDNVVMRITNIDNGQIGNPKIKLAISEDIFGLLSGVSVTPPNTLHDDGARAPTEAEYVLGMTMPAFLAAQFGGTMTGPDEAFTAIMASTVNSDASSYNLYVLGTNIVGDAEWVNLGARGFNGRGVLQDDLPGAVTSTMTLVQLTRGVGPVVNGFMLIEGADETEHEIVLLQEQDSNGDWVVQRGMLDTVPRDWEAGAPIWFINTDSPFGDPTIRIEGETPTYKVVPRTSLGALPLADADPFVVTISNRTYAPLRPADVKINSQPFGVVDAVGAPSVTVTWANRNREMEETRVYFWNDGNLTPPVGETTTIKIYDVLDNLLATDTGITGVSHVLDAGDYAGYSTIKVRAYASLDGEESLQGHEITVLVLEGGFGLQFGLNFGGA